MSELLRALVYIAVLSLATFWVAARATPEMISKKEFRRWTASWLIVVGSVFIANNIWFFVTFFIAFSLIRLPANPALKIHYYLILFCAVPVLPVEIPGFFGIRYIFRLTYPILLVLAVLLPIFLKSRAKIRWLKLKPDALVLSYVILTSYLSFRDDTFTNGLRESLLICIQVLIPYYTLSRELNNLEQLNKAFTALLIGVAPFALIGVFETVRHWHLYNSLAKTLTEKPLSTYDMRSGELRASANFGSPIVLGYAMVICLGLLTYLKPLIKNQQMANLAGLTMIFALLATMARGGWVGAAVFLVVYIWTGPGRLKKLTLWGFAGFAAFPFILMTSVGNKIIDLLPFIGTQRSDTVEYRAKLIDQAMIVFERNPWFGSTNYLETPEMESMRQGQGIIDLVNTFIQIILPFGVVGLILFISIFLSLIVRHYFILKKIPEHEEDLFRMGRVLLAILVSIMAMIATVSSIDYVAPFYWAFSGIAAGYLRVAGLAIDQYKAEQTSKKSRQVIAAITN